MLRRIVAEADAPAAGSVKAGEHGIARPPLRTLNGFGVLGPPPAQAEPIGDDFSGVGDMLHPPGFYGTRDQLWAVNALAPGEKLAATISRFWCTKALWRSRRQSIFVAGRRRRLSLGS